MTHPGLSKVLKGGKVWVRLLRASVPSLWPASTFAPDLFAPPAPSPRPTTLPSFLPSFLPSPFIMFAARSVARKATPLLARTYAEAAPATSNKLKLSFGVPHQVRFVRCVRTPGWPSRTIHRSLHSSSAQLTDNLPLSPPRRPSSPAPRLSRSTSPERAE
jgi:hypothetical protein